LRGIAAALPYCLLVACPLLPEQTSPTCIQPSAKQNWSKPFSEKGATMSQQQLHNHKSLIISYQIVEFSLDHLAAKLYRNLENNEIGSKSVE